MEYGKRERLIASYLDKYPIIKKGIKYLYQCINLLFHYPRRKYFINNKCSIKKISKTNISFFGYYDKPSERNGNYIYHAKNVLRKNEIHKTRKINIYLNNEVIDSTETWNLQQGAMLSWINDENIYYNKYENGFVSVIYNIKNKSKKTIYYPLYAVDKECKFGLSLNFSRLALLRPDYGYFNENYKTITKNDLNDGIYFVDLNTNKRKLIISFDTLLNFQTREEMRDAWHKVNHIELSPNGKRFIFHHRWYDSKGRKYSRLFSANIDGSDLFLLSDDKMVSHCIWRNNNEIVGWMRKVKHGDQYYLLIDKTDSFSIIGEGILNEDGHPSFSSNGRWLLTDTYPDKSRLSHIYLFDMEKNKKHEIGCFYSSMKYNGEYRCDLHPRFNSDFKGITFDSVFSGKRSLYEINIEKLIEEEK